MDPLQGIDTTKLDASFYGMLLGFLGGCLAHGLTLKATEGYRDPARSDQLYAEWMASGMRGPRAAPGGKSAHNFGCAVDFLAFRNGQPVKQSSEPEYGLMEEIAPRYGLRTLRALNDGGHVELDDWQRHTAMFGDVVGGSSTV